MQSLSISGWATEVKGGWLFLILLHRKKVRLRSARTQLTIQAISKVYPSRSFSNLGYAG
jgi:hypothetical protein